jgi:hypothetical protein
MPLNNSVRFTGGTSRRPYIVFCLKLPERTVVCRSGAGVVRVDAARVSLANS